MRPVVPVPPPAPAVSPPPAQAGPTAQHPAAPSARPAGALGGQGTDDPARGLPAARPAGALGRVAGPWARLRGALGRARQLWRDFTGESAYDRYVERHRLEHPDHEPMGERQWWRARAELDERNVQAGCC